MDGAIVSIENVCGQNLRVAHWRLQEPSHHVPVLFFNGIGSNIEAIAPLMEAMEERAFITFDMPGVGGSPDPIAPYNPFTICLAAMALLERLGVEEVDVMGLSWGGGIAQQFAMQYPHNVRRVVLAATSAGMLMVPGSLLALGKLANPFASFDAGYFLNFFKSLFAAGLAADPQRRNAMSRLTPPSPVGYFYQMASMAGWTSAPALPFLLKQETLILTGDEDAIVPPANSHILDMLIPNGERQVIKGGGHLFLLSHIDECIAAIRVFLDRPALPDRDAA